MAAMEMETLMNYLLGCLCLFLLLILGKFLYTEWWTPIFIQSLMRSQGIKGPSYRFLHGNTKEITNMRNETMKNPMELSHHVLPRIQPHIYSWIKLYGMNFLLWYGTRAQLTVTEPELVKEILNSKEEAYCKKGFQEYIKKLLGDGLVLSSGKKWLKMRKLANHAFHGESLKSMVPAMVESVEVMLKRWGHHEEKEIDVFQEFKVLTSEIISRTAFGSSYLEGEKIFDMLKKMTTIIARNHYKVRIPGIKFLKTKDEVEMDKLEEEIRDTIINMVKKREEAAMMGELDSYGNDFLGLLVQAYNEEDKNMKISIDDLIDECKNFYVAGQETTASSLTWLVFLLAIHTDWQDKARKEVLQLFGQQNPTADGVAKLKTMSMIINESLRLYSPVFHITREVQKEVKLGKLTIPANMETHIPTLALHTDHQIWGEDALIFKPERFADGVAKATNNSISSFVPFGLGARTCVGLNFAITEEKIALSMILQHFRFTLSPTYVHSPVQILTVCPQHGVQIILEAL
ncbi:cytochrome P450 CYP749A22 isoform X2 [Manihot esculenta]|uniref:cytochrome P450 CYP749A22 isoform X2 n=1 Tax=Manihot esculenta TaxID=3983 RepID=UPI000B5D18BC|nr:cytochrome P450 CYP749A22 isoform X2 [Manihot esculenta]